jgi:tRNA(Ile)-lysidine synthase
VSAQLLTPRVYTIGMEVNISAGKYVLAVSGGVDSMALLNLLSKEPNLELVVAHFNHGIRPDSTKDEELVARRAKQLKLPFETGYGHLSKNASEDTARKARYAFLNSVKTKHRADAIITAHHQDDLIETAVLNILRGTGRRGLSAISANKKVLRPLLDIPKVQIIEYAENNNLEWLEDSTNQDTDYLRNYVRIKLMPRLSAQDRENLISNIDKVAKTNRKLDDEIATLSHAIYAKRTINRADFTNLSTDVSSELLTFWLRSENIGEFDRKTISRLNLAVKAAKAGTKHPVKGFNSMVISAEKAEFNITP